AILESQGLTHDHIVKTSIFLKSMGDFAQINEIYGSYFSGNYPARETVEVAGLPKGVNVEISVIAVKF
ncbi:MAG: Rid family hydrolase, partial [Bacteroidota bacterium]